MIKPDIRTIESMKAGEPGEWQHKATPIPGKNARKRAARLANNGAPRKFATIDGKRVEVRQAPPKDARPYPTAPVTARPGSRYAATELRGNSDPLIKGTLPRRGIGPKLDVVRPMSRREQSNNLPFMPEFQAEGQPYPRMARDKDGNVTPRVRTDNGMTEQLKGRGIARREDGKPTYARRQLEANVREREAQYAALMDHARYREAGRQETAPRVEAKQALREAQARKREAIERGDEVAAETAQLDITRFRKAARYKG